MDNYRYLKVFYNNTLAGTLAKTPDKVAAFEYDSDWLNNGFSISPFSLPLVKKVFIPKYEPFGGLFGVFNDSYSSSFNGEHATTINGEGKNPALDDILTVAKNIGLKEKPAKDTALDIQEKCAKLFN